MEGKLRFLFRNKDDLPILKKLLDIVNTESMFRAFRYGGHDDNLLRQILMDLVESIEKENEQAQMRDLIERMVHSRKIQETTNAIEKMEIDIEPME